MASVVMIDGHILNWDVMSIVFPQEFPLSLVCEYKNQLNLKLVLDLGGIASSAENKEKFLAGELEILDFLSVRLR